MFLLEGWLQRSVWGEPPLLLPVALGHPILRMSSSTSAQPIGACIDSKFIGSLIDRSIDLPDLFSDISLSLSFFFLSFFLSFVFSFLFLFLSFFLYFFLSASYIYIYIICVCNTSTFAWHSGVEQ